MPLTVADVNALQEYICGVMDRADHHASSVNEIVLALAGAIVWKKDASDIKVWAQQGQAGNVLWVHIGGRRYAFSYNHAAGKIEMREGSIQGRVLQSFANATPLSDVKKILGSL